MAPLLHCASGVRVEVTQIPHPAGSGALGIQRAASPRMQPIEHQVSADIASRSTALRLAREHGFRVRSSCHPAKAVPGDFVEVSWAQDRLIVVIGDACGNGAPAYALARQIRPTLLELLRTNPTPIRLFERLNAALYSLIADHLFITAECCCFDLSARTLTVANAGHVPVVLGPKQDQPYLVGHATAPPLGMFPTLACGATTVPFGPGDAMLVMTDGFVEAFEGYDARLFEMRRLLSLVGRGSRDTLHDRVLTEVVRQNLVPNDDATLVTVNFSPDTPPRSSRLDQPWALAAQA